MSVPTAAKLWAGADTKAPWAAAMSADVPWGLNSLGALLSLPQAATASARTAAANDRLA
jgi:hypothetical protein